ncbi:MAG: hypothetical protein QNK37_21270 [Acidobacteriota bacterium]|nr:hypothetical protein [Acidobacteriota bacterium]
MIRDIFALNRLGFYQIKNKFRTAFKQRPLGVAFLLLLGVGFYWGYLWLSARLVSFIYNQEVFGVLLANKLLEFLLYISVGMALLSSLTTAITHFYMSKDLEFHFSLPVSFNSWVLHRFGQVFLQSSWMLMLFGASFIWLFLEVSETNLLVRISGVLVYAILCSYPVIASSLVCMLLVKIFPARRVHQMFLIVTVVMVCSVILVFRYLEPEQYLGPGGLDKFRGLVDLMENRRQPWNPAIWGADLFAAWNQKEWQQSVVPGMKILGLFIVAMGTMLIAARNVYRSSWDRALQALSGEADLLEKQTKLTFISKWLSHKHFSQEVRELTLFLRDPSQWSQVFVLAALLALYLFSVSKVTPSLLGASKYTMALLNTLFVSFISLSISSRFVFTSFSADGQAIWLMKTAPEGWYKYMRGKLLVFGGPCLFFSLLLGVFSGMILGLDGSQLKLLAMHGLWDASFMILLSLSLGMLFINPGTENPLKLIISPGGMLLMVIGVFFAAVHLVLRLTEQHRTLNAFLETYGWPNMQDGNGLYFILGMVLAEAIVLLVLVRRGMDHLRTGNFLS